MKSVFVICILSGVGPLLGQGEEAPAEPRRDPEAVKLLERFDSLVSVPKAEGLKDVEFTTRLPNGLDLVLRWKHPDKIASDLKVPPDAPERHVEALKLTAQNKKNRAEAAQHAASFVKLVVGESLMEQHEKDELVLVAPDKVKVVARSEESTAAFKEQTITFAESGLVKESVVTAPTGRVDTIAPAFESENGKHRYRSLTTSVGPEKQTVTFHHESVGDFKLITKIVIGASGEGARRAQTLEFRDMKANSGLDDELFEEAKPK